MAVTHLTPAVADSAFVEQDAGGQLAPLAHRGRSGWAAQRRVIARMSARDVLRASVRAHRPCERRRARCPTVLVVPGVLRFRYLENHDGAWTSIARVPERIRRPVLVILTGVALGALASLLFTGASVLGLAWAAGGLIGNLVDRLRLGYVVDFVEFDVGPVAVPILNVADIGLGLGLLLLALRGLGGARREP